MIQTDVSGSEMLDAHFAKGLGPLLSVPVLTVKAQEWGAVGPAGDQIVSKGASGITGALGGWCFMR